EAADHGRQLHAVVGGVALAAEQLLLAVRRHQQHAPAAGTGIALAGPVGVQRNVAHESRRNVSVSRSRRVAGAKDLRRSRRTRAGMMTRMPATRFIARRKYTPPA